MGVVASEEEGWTRPEAPADMDLPHTEQRGSGTRRSKVVYGVRQNTAAPAQFTRSLRARRRGTVDVNEGNAAWMSVDGHGCHYPPPEIPET